MLTKPNLEQYNISDGNFQHLLTASNDVDIW